MVDHVSASKRSDIMRSVRSRDTGPERIVRSAAHRLGLRFRLHAKDLPGKPDMTFPKWKTVLFVHGCYWHRHKNCPKATMPKSNVDFWTAKFSTNVARDNMHYRQLKRLGWRVLIFWQCEVGSRDAAEDLLRRRFPCVGFEADQPSEQRRICCGDGDA